MNKDQMKGKLNEAAGKLQEKGGEITGNKEQQAKGLGNRFKENFNAAVAQKRLPSVDWGQGIWQKVLKVYDGRKAFAHVVPGIARARLLAPVQEADEAITILRDGIKAVTTLASLPAPPWVSDDGEEG